MKDDYLAYLIRFQRRHDKLRWRVLLRDATTGEEKQFATVHDLMYFLLQELADRDATWPGAAD